jgi:hypothetical protein
MGTAMHVMHWPDIDRELELCRPTQALRHHRRPALCAAATSAAGRGAAAAPAGARGATPFERAQASQARHVCGQAAAVRPARAHA